MSTLSTRDRVCEILAEEGIDAYGIYCQVTGKMIGSSCESNALILDLAASGLSPESIADDLAVRILASMRPSLRWNKMRAESLIQMHETAPIDTLAYLLNRLFAPLNSRKMGVEERLGDLTDRIKGHQILTQWGMDAQLDAIYFMLLELDAKWNLDTESAPFTAADFYGYGHYFENVTHDERIAMLKAFFDRRMADWQKLQKQLEMQTNWSRHGNPLAKPLFGQEWLRREPPSQAAIVRKEKRQEQALMDNMLAAILGESNLITPEQVQAAKPVVVIPSTKMPVRFGIKKVEG